MHRYQTTLDFTAGVIHTGTGRHEGMDRWERTDTAAYYTRPITGNASIAYAETWLLAGRGFIVSRFQFHPSVTPTCDWYLDIDTVTVNGTLWTVDDRYLDLYIHDGRGYDLLDADEFADAIEDGTLSGAESLAALRDLHTLCTVLPSLGYRGTAILDAYAPDLPQ